MISEQRVQRVPRTARGRLWLLTGAVLLSTIAGSAWTDNPVASGEWEPGIICALQIARLHWRAFIGPLLVYEMTIDKHLAIWQRVD